MVAQHKTSRKTSKRRTSSKSMKKVAPQRARATDVKRSKSGKSKSVGDEEVTIDRRRSIRRQEDRELAANPPATAPALERRQKVNRRRQIDPTTCERDYTEQEVEFMNAIDEYKRKSGRMFPTCSEVLEVIRSLGYVKISAAEAAGRREVAPAAGSAKPMPSDWSATPQTDTAVEAGR